MPNIGSWFGRILLFLAGLFVCLLSPTCSKDVSTNHWLVELRDDVGPETAMEVAKRTGFTFVAPMLGSPREFHFIHNAVPNVRMRRSVLHTRLLKAHPLVKRAVQQLGYVRAKRGFKPLKGVPVSDIKLTAPDIEHFLLNHDLTAQDIQQDGKSAHTPNDPLFAKEWYLKNTGQSGGILGLDLNVEAAWAMGYTGKKITTAIMDDGIDYLHEDLKHNYNAQASYDFSSNDPYPYPRYTDTWFNSHGTRCAGEVSAARDNKVCGVGVAYDSKVAGLRMLDQPFMTDLIEANAMGHMPNDIDIYSASWGPTDDGKTVDGPRNMTMRAIVHGVNEGRRGLGNIYVWASGDGGADDDCNCDGYAASMWTISINSATNDGQTAGYDESCSSTLASTFSNGKSTLRDAGVATTDLYNNCTTTHSGTSAAAPEAAGVFALALEANRNLTWRDMQHLTVLTSKRNKLFDPYQKHHWKYNGAGLLFNHLFGYGVLDAAAMVDLARQWKPLPERFHCTGGSVTNDMKFATNQPIQMHIDTDACHGSDNEINYLEHVQAFVTLKSTYRGNVVIFITSPTNTTSMILSQRPNDDDHKNGFTRWPFMTTHTWAENPHGRWKLEITLVPGKNTNVDTGTFFEWTLIFHGTRTAPYKNQVADEMNHGKLFKVKRIHQEKA
ncbi:neuroendocrine convertase 2-like [Pecten maximus]|uniref:neuroendocrine convertase 2-like n=1 Tax=Pecten maximus TaxID=6579 RepID=UPI001458F3D8|nr:neuroendocrine convertase 2-like [Pecten maximus]